MNFNDTRHRLAELSLINEALSRARMGEPHRAEARRSARDIATMALRRQDRDVLRSH